jgi:dTMP kinase
MSRGLFVTFEGGDGTGKSTQIARLAARLKAAGHAPLATREPGGTPLAEAIRALLLDPEQRPSALAEVLLVEAARADLVERVIRPALERGAVVLCDRFADSTLAYQGAGRGLDATLLAAWSRAATAGLRPDLTLLFDLEPGMARGRRAAAAEGTNRLDREPAEFHQRVRACYLELARAEPERFVVLDAALDPDRLEAEVWSAVAERLAPHPRRAG